MTQDIERLRSIKSFPSLVRYLRDELDWPIESEDVEDLTFEYEAEELGLDARTAAKIKEIKQLRPFVTGQPWGIFYINFEPKQLPVVALRRILSKLVLKKRASGNKAQQASWLLNDLLFISSYGESDERAISFAHFSEDKVFGDLPTLRVLGWDSQDTVLRLEDVEQTLGNKLRWPEDESNVEDWRKSWSSAFTLRPREVIRTSKELAIRLADLATLIRARVNQLLAIESEKGPLRKLLKAFQEALIHDLDEDGFADMYAQTIAYGLLTARVSRPAGLIADNIHDLPNTNPFLKEQLEAFLTVGGRRGKIDFDELGVNEVVELLRNANMEAVLKDFGDRNPQEDPVIHFYELFLKEYDSEKRMKRGVFYTPRPVVSFIVRSVDEILRTEFGLENGLADTTTWSEMAKRKGGLHIPEDVKPDEPFVQILDPATGTGTFLVEVIDVIHRTMIEKWNRDGKSDAEVYDLWNEYVPRHLLPRLHGFELMMAPYSIAHMKIGLKLRETHYSFLSSERARIYLTNTLEESRDFSGYFEQMAPALAHEAQEANKIKTKVGFTVVLGNPPYSKVSSNRSEDERGNLTLIGKLIEDYRFVDGQPLGERNPKWLQDDYVKFIRFAASRIESTGYGTIGFITNHGYIDNPTFRGMRQKLTGFFNELYGYNLHGNTRKKEKAPGGSEDSNVFDIQQGVAILLGARTAIGSRRGSFHYADLWGPRQDKYNRLDSAHLGSTIWEEFSPTPSSYLFVPQDQALLSEYTKGSLVTDIFEVYASTVTTARNDFAMAYEPEILVSRIEDLKNKSTTDDTLRKKYQLKDVSYWTLASARKQLSALHDIRNFVKGYCYRPFDFRFVFYHRSVCERLRLEVMRHMNHGNLALLTHRPQSPSDFTYVYCTTRIGDQCVAANKSGGGGNSFQFPLFLHPTETSVQGTLHDDGERRTNLNGKFIRAIEATLDLPDTASDSVKSGLTPEDIFHFIYAILHSPSYRSRYAEFLKMDFPRVPLTSDVELFLQVGDLGADLVALHTLDDDYETASWNMSQSKDKSPLKTLITHFAGKGSAEVAKGYPKFKDDNVFINPSRYFEGVPEEVWNFQIGGYQVCEKWLKDRRGRTLSEEDINHYQRVVVAINETIRLMAEIDRVIEEHGGWPLVGSQVTPKAEAARALPFG